MKKRLLGLLLIPTLFLAGCGANEAGYGYNKDAAGAEVQTDQGGSQIVMDTTAKIVYTVSYVIRADDITPITYDVKSKTYSIGGYIESSSESDTYASIIYRIPTDSLDSFIDYIDAKDGVNDKTVSTTDISSSYSQVEARLKVLTDQKAYYNDYLEDNKDTLTLNEKISVLDKISDIDAEIYEYTYSKDKMDTKLNYSTVTITYRANSKYVEETWFSQYGDFLKDFGEGLIDFIMYSLPFALVGGVIFSAIYFPITISSKKKKAKKDK